ncbi:MAG: alpha-L-fucosidase [Bacteroidales bacterium]|nr:alpha-L-fucosidase [Bacteroidales bacterium]
MKKALIITLAMLMLTACTTPEPYGPVPTEAQLAWQRMEINMFCHFGPNTFTGAEWGSGQEDKEVFAPTALDCGQWVDVARQAGMGGIILTAKHHDGFCLWPSAYSTHTVPDSLDILRALRTAIDAHNSSLKMGVYISPWDRNHPAYGTPEYNTVFANTLKEVHTQYGPFFEQWFDGACGEGPNGRRQEYDWPLFEGTVLDINPQCILFSDVGPGCRWVGNEEGHADDTNWSRLKVESGKRTTENGGCGDIDGDRWIPAEVDVSIRPGWFWHKDEHPKTMEELMEIYYNSVGRNGLLLLNVPPDTNGRISPEDSAVLMAFRHERDRIFSNDLTQGAQVSARSRLGHSARNVLDTAYHTYWAATSDNAAITLNLDNPEDFDLIVIQEYIPLGQRVSHFSIFADGSPVAEGTTVGYKRIIRCDTGHWHAAKLELHFNGLAPPIINRIALYNTQAQ